MSQPIKTIKEFIDWIEQREKRSLLYRGLADAEWKVESSAYRRIKKSEGEVPPRVFQNYIERLLNLASLQGFKRRGGDELSDLELLAELQHNGAATCLVDFTSNALIALWFACREERGEEGKVVAIATENPDDFSDVSYEDLEKPVKEFLNQDKLWKWNPSSLSNRIVAQGSVFVFGAGVIEKERWLYEEIKVDANSKGKIREILKEKFGLSEESLFSDFTGFAQSNAHDKPYSDYTAEDYLSVGLAFHQRGDLEKAIDAYDKALQRNSQYASAYYNLGVAKHVLGDNQEAISNLELAIKLNPEDAEAYNQRGIAEYNLKDYQVAIADFGRAIDINPQYAEAFYNRGVAESVLGEYQRAVDDLNRAIKLNPQDADFYYQSGLAKRALGDEAGAEEDFDKAKELDPSLEPPESS